MILILMVIFLASSMKNMSCDNYRDNIMDRIGGYTFSARGVQAYLETEIARFLYFSNYFLFHRRSSEARATVILCRRPASHREISRPVHRHHESKRASLTNGCRRRMLSRPLPVPRTFSHSQLGGSYGSRG